MSETRTDLLNEGQVEASALTLLFCHLPKLPPDIIRLILAMIHAGNNDELIEKPPLIVTVSTTRQGIYTFFKPELDKLGAKKLLDYVLKGGKGCELFLMSNVDNIIKISDARHLYLYKDKENNDERIYYKIHGEDNKQYLDDSAIKIALAGEHFNQPAENPTGCTKRDVRNRVLKVTFKRGHTFEDATEATVKIAETNPKLFFIKATGLDHAMDLAGNRRTIADWSPYQALFGTHNKELLAAVKPFLDIYLSTQQDGFAMAAAQEQEKFPNGFDFPPCTDEFNQWMNAWEEAVTNDQPLRQNWKNPSPATLELLAQHKSYRKPGVVLTGHHFNMNDLIKTYEIHDKNWSNSRWNGNQLSFFDVFVIGSEKRLLTAPYLDATCTGLNNHIYNDEPLKGTFVVINYVTNKTVSVVPFELEDPGCRLGEGFVIDSYWSGGRSCISPSWPWRSLFEKLCPANTAELSRLSHTPKKQTVFSLCVIA